MSSIFPNSTFSSSLIVEKRYLKLCKPQEAKNLRKEPTKQKSRKRIETILKKTKCILSLTLILIGLIFAGNLAETCAQYAGNQKLELSPSSGYKNTFVEVSVDVGDYLYIHNIYHLLERYIGNQYLLVWDPLGPSNDYSPANLYTPHNLYSIGTATIGDDGILTGYATIPDEGSIEDVHYIYAVYEDIEPDPSANYREWWWAPFNYVLPPADRYTVDVTVEPAGAGAVAISPYEISYTNGAEITLTASAGTGWKFGSWSGDVSSYSNPKVFWIVSKNYQITANFIQDTPTPTSSPGTICFLSAALLGGPLSQEVAFTRHVRDDLVGSNNVGQAVVKGWNAFYYSWSPPVAYVTASSSQLRAVATVLLTPLLGIVRVVELQYNLLATANSELASMLSFATAAILSTAIYIAIPIWLVYSLLKPKSWLKQKIKRRA